MSFVPVHILTRMDSRVIPENAEEIRLVSPVRNEMARLPYFLDYYRELGVNRFLFIDNNSDDGTTTYLLRQPDCHVFHTTDSYRESRFALRWINRLLDMYGTGHWCVVADADELLVYPRCEQVNLRQLCAYLDRFGYEGLFTFLLDMYHPTDMAEAVCVPGKAFTEICPMFDRDYCFVRRSVIDMMRLPGRPPPFPETEVIGGPRARIFYPEQNTPRVFPRIKARLIGRVLGLLAQCHLLDPDRVPHMSGILFKVPLVKWRKGCAYYSSTHILTPVKLADVTGALLHFKFFSDFYQKAVVETARGEHEGGGRQYRRYAKMMEQNGGKLSLCYEGSERYTGSDTLLAHKLMTSSPSYEQEYNEIARCEA